MSKALDAVLERVSRLPTQRQDEIAIMVERMIDPDESGRLTAEHWAEIDRRLASDPKFASDEEVETFFRSALA